MNQTMNQAYVRPLFQGLPGSLQRYAREIDEVRAAVLRFHDADACGMYHGPDHWYRVFQNAIVVSAAAGVDPLVPCVFALVHDSQRLNDGQDPLHGARAAAFVRRSRAGLFSFLSDSQIDELALACRDHSSGETQGPLLVQICWDADRLDLGRVGLRPCPTLLCTQFAKRKETIDQACSPHGFEDPTSDEDDTEEGGRPRQHSLEGVTSR